jgi:glycosyltransferase involved in cell wall biosynthesis
LLECLSSIGASTRRPFVIVIDDGSREPVEIDFAAYGLNGLLLRTPQNQGVAAALNASVARALEADFEYIARMDCDDLVFPHRFEAQVDLLERCPSALAAFSAAVAIDGAGRPIGSIAAPPSQRQFRLKMAFNNVVVHPTVMFRRAFFARYPLYDPSVCLAEDYDLFLRPAFDGAFVFTPDPLVYYRIHSGGVSVRKYRSQVGVRARVQARYLLITGLVGLIGLTRTLLLWLLSAAIPTGFLFGLRQRFGLRWLKAATIRDG